MSYHIVPFDYEGKFETIVINTNVDLRYETGEFSDNGRYEDGGFVAYFKIYYDNKLIYNSYYERGSRYGSREQPNKNLSIKYKQIIDNLINDLLTSKYHHVHDYTFVNYSELYDNYKKQSDRSGNLIEISYDVKFIDKTS